MNRQKQILEKLNELKSKNNNAVTAAKHVIKTLVEDSTPLPTNVVKDGGDGIQLIWYLSNTEIIITIRSQKEMSVFCSWNDVDGILKRRPMNLFCEVFSILDVVAT